LLALPLALGVVLCSCSRSPTQVYTGPQIVTVLATPDTLGPSDSTVVECVAIDRAGDALVYDWVTDARLKIQGVPANRNWLYTTRSNRHVFYTGPVYAYPLDTAWVQCFARDLKGGEDARTINILLHH